MELRRTLTPMGMLLALAVVGAAAAQDPQDPAEERERLARLAYIEAETAVDSGLAQPELVYLWSVRWLDAKRERAAAEEPVALQEHLERMKGLRGKTDALIASGMLPTTVGTAVGFYVAEGEVWVRRGKR